jgi:hypothetical protein
MILVPATLFWSLRLLVKTIRDATASTFDSSIDAFKVDMMEAVAVDQFRVALRSAFEQALSQTRLAYSSFAALLRLVTVRARRNPLIRQYAPEKKASVGYLRGIDRSLSWDHRFL